MLLTRKKNFIFKMERKFTPRVQGGGTGQGFQPPHGINRYEKPNFKGICQSIISCCELKAGGGESSEPALHSVYCDHLKRRLFLLHERSKIPTTSGSHTASLTENCAVYNIEDIFIGNATSQDRSAVHVKYIPNLPSSLPEAVHLWRFGSLNGQYHPIRLFRSAEKRKEMISNYSHKLWSSGGQKSAYYRYKDLIEAMEEVAPVLWMMDIWEEGDDDKWNRIICEFQNSLPENLQNSSLSGIISYIRK